MVISLKEGTLPADVIKRLRDVGADVRSIEFTSYFRVDGVDKAIVQGVEGVKKVGETLKELR